MIYWERETNYDNRPFFVLEVEMEGGDTLKEFREFVEEWVYKTKIPKRYFRVDWHKGDRGDLGCVVVDGDSQADCFFSGLRAAEFFTGNLS